ncbi:hypothetical protein FKM82_021446, partial [Ascaphus truei]
EPRTPCFAQHAGSCSPPALMSGRSGALADRGKTTSPVSARAPQPVLEKMAAPLVLVVLVAVTIRAILFRSSLAGIISERVEVVSPLSSWKRVVEGLSLLDLGVSPYSGDVFHETPLTLYLFHFLVEYAEIVFMITDALTAVALYLAVQEFNKVTFKKQKLLLELKKYSPESHDLLRSPTGMYYVPLKVAIL